MNIIKGIVNKYIVIVNTFKELKYNISSISKKDKERLLKHNDILTFLLFKLFGGNRK